MWFRGQYVPILYDTSGPYRGFGSKDWVPRNYLQRVVALMFGTIFAYAVMLGGAALTINGATKVRGYRCLCTWVLIWETSFWCRHSGNC
jgi:hypothetical protein